MAEGEVENAKLREQLAKLREQLAKVSDANAKLKEENAKLKEQDLKRQVMYKHKTVLPYREVISTLTNRQFIALEGNDNIKHIIKILAISAIQEYTASGVYNGRVNEFGNHMETLIKSRDNIHVSKPRTIGGKFQATGYPDCFVETLSGKFYLEIKIFKKGSEGSKFRSFFICDAKKITHSCPHYLLGFEHQDKVLTGKYHIVDMYCKNLKLKCEWNTDNCNLYPL